MKTPKRLILTALSLLVVIVHPYLVAQQDQTIYDKDITVVSFEEMRYPPLARQAHIQGTVVVKVKLDDAGKVTSATAIVGARLLISDCLANARKWRFHPTPGNGAIIIYEFRLADGTCNAEQNHLFVFRRPNVASVTGCEEVWQP